MIVHVVSSKYVMVANIFLILFCSNSVLIKTISLLLFCVMYQPPILFSIIGISYLNLNGMTLVTLPQIGRVVIILIILKF